MRRAMTATTSGSCPASEHSSLVIGIYLFLWLLTSVAADHGINCFGPLPGGQYKLDQGGLTHVYTDLDFSNLWQLCAHASKKRGTFGFYCEDIMHEVAHDPFDQDRLFFYSTEIWNYCTNNCVCRSSYFRYIQKLHDADRVGEAYDLTKYWQKHGLAQHSICGDKSPGACVKLIREGIGGHDPVPEDPNVDPERDHPVCTTRCSNFKCSSHEEGCRCVAVNFQNGRFRNAQCALLAGAAGALGVVAKGRGTRGGRKRNEMTEVGCPCNGSYVSSACCDADGIVWEPPHMKLGVMDLT